MSNWHGGKGSDQRKSQISMEEEDLRWKLISAPASEKEAIKERIKELEAIRNKKRV